MIFVLEIDYIPYTITFSLGLFVSVETGLIAGTITHLCMLMYRATVPDVKIELRKTNEDIEYYLVRPDRALFFPAVDDIRVRLGAIAAKGKSGNTRQIVIDLSFVVEMDFTAAKVFS